MATGAKPSDCAHRHGLLKPQWSAPETVTEMKQEPKPTVRLTATSAKNLTVINQFMAVLEHECGVSATFAFKLTRTALVGWTISGSSTYYLQ
jgi:hypothetical protein